MQYNGNQDIRVLRRYFSGTTELRKGQVLCYNEAASETGTLPNRLGVEVEAMNTDNKNYIAGIVPDSEAGKEGPCWVELLAPSRGDVLDIEVDGTTDVAAGDLLEADGTASGLIKATAAAGDQLFRALEAQASDSKVAIKCFAI